MPSHKKNTSETRSIPIADSPPNVMNVFFGFFVARRRPKTTPKKGIAAMGINPNCPLKSQERVIAVMIFPCWMSCWMMDSIDG